MRKLFTLLTVCISSFFIQHSNAQTVHGWYNFGNNLQYVSNAGVDYYLTHIFPDSSVQVEYSGGLGHVWMHGVGQVIDPTSWIFDFGGTSSIDDQTAYYVDSIAIPYRYFRNQTSADDTLIIQFYREGDITSYIDDPWDGQGVYDDHSYARINYDTLKYRGETPYYEITKLLTDDDITPNGKEYMTFHIGEFVPAGEVVAATYTYYPGHAYSFGDTLDAEFTPVPTNPMNDFIGNYYIDGERNVEVGMYNHGVIATASARYNDNSNGWGAQYWPGVASSSGIYHIDMDFYLTSTLGLKEEDISDRIKVYPNPCTDAVQLDLSGFTDNEVTVELIDNEGKTVANFGTHTNSGSLNIDMTEYAKGVYALKISGKTEIVKKRIIKS